MKEKQGSSETKTIIDNLTQAFFSLFSSKDGVKPNLEDIYQLFIGKGMIIKNTGVVPEIYTLAEFIEPRIKLLSDGTLVDFKEEEVAGRTEIFGNIAQRFSSYVKSGVLSGQPFVTRGMKTIQFINTPAGWKISSLAWDDEREGLTLPEQFDTSYQ